MDNTYFCIARTFPNEKGTYDWHSVTYEFLPTHSYERWKSLRDIGAITEYKEVRIKRDLTAPVDIEMIKSKLINEIRDIIEDGLQEAKKKYDSTDKVESDWEQYLKDKSAVLDKAHVEFNKRFSELEKLEFQSKTEKDA